ncbi:MAG: sigma-70 family RNA polymerase sigma factor [Acidobacteriaceae bacterium]|nr:sigma-70 family RNA polymerase sigma factor [Acidobacteriaceae bacterium]
MDSGKTQQMQNRAEMANHGEYREMADDSLVQICQDGDNEAFDELMRRHQAAVMKIALSIVRDKQDAEDEVQNAFWKAYEHISQFQRDAKFSTWLTRIVVNQCLMRLRQARRAKFTYLDEVQPREEMGPSELPDLRQSPEESLGEFEVAQVLDREIRRTPPLLRNVFLLRDVQERPMTEVAAGLGISVAAAKSRLLRARTELRNRMQRHACQAHGTQLSAGS